MEELLKELTESKWLNQLKFREKLKQYTFSIRFEERFIEGPNLVQMFFNEKGEFIETKTYIFYNYPGKTKEEMQTEYVRVAFCFKKDIEILIQKLISLKDKEKITFKRESYLSEMQYLSINFELDELNYRYLLELNNPQKKVLECTYSNLKTRGFMVVQLENIPSLKEICEYVLNHPKIRVKFVNQLAGYEK